MDELSCLPCRRKASEKPEDSQNVCAFLRTIYVLHFFASVFLHFVLTPLILYEMLCTCLAGRIQRISSLTWLRLAEF